MKIELVEDTFTLKAFGEELTLTYPTGDAVDKMNEELGLPDNKGREIKVMRSFFKGLGMPEEVLAKLQINHYQQIIKGFTPKKD